MKDQDISKLYVRNQAKAKMIAKDAPWNMTTPDELGPGIMNFCAAHEPYFRRWAESWFSIFQFLFGNHNFKWSRKWGFAIDYDFLRSPSNGTHLRAYTNLARIAIESLTSAMYGNMPEWDAETIDESSIRGRRSRKIMKALLDGMFQSLMMDKDVSAAAFVYSCFGQFAFEANWDTLGGKIIEVKRYTKNMNQILSSYMAPNPITQGLIEVPTPVVDSMGFPMHGESWNTQLDKMGREIVDKIFAGSPCVNVLTPLEYQRDVGSLGMHKTKSVRIFRLVDYDVWLDRYGQLDGRTKFFDNVHPVYSDPVVYQFAMRLFMRMQMISPPAWQDLGERWGSALNNTMFKYKVLVVEHYDAPHPKKWPEGRRVIVANGQCTHITKPSYNTEKLDGWHPLSEAQWMNCYPSSIASGPMQDVVRKNIELNVKDSLIATAIRRNMGSQLLVKTGMGIDPQQLIGEPGLSYEVNDPFGIRWLHDDMPIPPVLAQLRQFDKDDTYEQSGALDSQRGEPATGSSSGYQEKQREEREDRRLSPAKKNFRNALAQCGEKLLYCLKQNVMALDDSTMGYLMKNAAGDFTPQDVVSFMTQPLPIGTEVKIVEESMAIKSKATHQAMLQELAQGAAGMRLQNAKVLDKYLKEFNAEVFRDGSAAHRDRAERENEAFLDMLRLGMDTEGVSRPIVIEEDDHLIHIEEHTDFIVKYWDLVKNNQAFLLQYYTHTEMHRLKQQEREGLLMPGTSLQTGTMVDMARKIPQPSVQTIYTKSIIDKQMQQQNPTPQPTAPRVPTGGPNGQTAPNPQAPSGVAQQQPQAGGAPNG